MKAAALLARAVELTPIGRAYARAVAGDARTAFTTRALGELDVALAAADDDLQHIPTHGPVIVVANHPYGALDGLVLLEAIGRIRGDAKLLGNELLRHVAPLREQLVLVDVFGRGATAVRRNGAAIRSAMRWLANGGALVVFPAGEVAHQQNGGRVIDSPWQDSAAELALRTGASVVPVFISGTNSRLFRAAGRIHPLLRTALLPRELWTKRHSTIEIRIGHAIAPDTLAAASDVGERTTLLRSHVDALALTGPDRNEFSTAEAEHQVAAGPAEAGHYVPQPIATRGMAAAIDANIDALHDRVLIESGMFQVFCAHAGDLPAVLPEIGRLRELTFRAAGEGTGLSRDLDRFDQSYRHVFVWDRVRRELAGAYRVGATDEVTDGVHGLYTRTLFDYDSALLSQIGPALELGRAFVQPAYQRDFSPLLLLWKGISRLVVQEPRYRRLFGVVSISDRYAATSRQLLLTFLQTTRFDADLGRLVKAKNPPPPPHHFVDSTTVERIEDVSALVRSIEPDGKDVPVLLRQYLKLNAKLLGFSVDSTFGNVLDGLVVVDLADVEPAILSRYMGRTEAKTFLARSASST